MLRSMILLLSISAASVAAPPARQAAAAPPDDRGLVGWLRAFADLPESDPSLAPTRDAAQRTPGTPYFFDDFSTPQLDAAKWTAATTARRFADDVTAPTPAGVLELSTDDPRIGDAGLRTCVIRLGDVPAATLSFFARALGARADNPLLVEYLDVDGVWQELGRCLRGGLDDAGYSYREFRLPPTALHNGLRLRFRANGADREGAWRLDEVRLADPDYTVSVNASALSDAGRAIARDNAAIVLLTDLGGGFEVLRTPSSRSYAAGTQVTLTASAELDGLTFLGWRVNGQARTASARLTLPLRADIDVEAIYGPTYTLRVETRPSIGATINLDSQVSARLALGTTPFVVSYAAGESVRLEAPEDLDGEPFRHWELDGTRMAWREPGLDVTVDRDHRAIAFFGASDPTAPLATLTLRSAPRVGLARIDARRLPADEAIEDAGVTRQLFEVGDVVPLSAPERIDGLVLLRWRIDGEPLPGAGAALLLRLAGDVDVVAEYGVLGDMNGDGVLDDGDIDLFALAMVDRDAYARLFPGLDADRLGDVNGDGTFDPRDIEPLANLLRPTPDAVAR